MALGFGAGFGCLFRVWQDLFYPPCNTPSLIALTPPACTPLGKKPRHHLLC